MDKLVRDNYTDKFCYFDCETESLSLFSNKPWEIGVTTYQGKKLIHEEVIYVKWPDFNITKIAAHITKYHIYNTERGQPTTLASDQTGAKSKIVEKLGITPKEACEKLCSQIYNKDTYSIGSNLFGFDLHVVNYLRRYVGMPVDYSIADRTYDTHALTKAHMLGLTPPSDKKENFTWQQKVINHPKRLRSGIKAACTHFGVEYKDDCHHDAIADNHMTRDIFLAATNVMDIK